MPDRPFLALTFALLLLVACGDAEPPAEPPPVAPEDPVGPVDPPEGPLDLGSGRDYGEATLVAFRTLLAKDGWQPADPPRNEQGLLEATHLGTGLVFVLVPGGNYRMGDDSRPTEQPAHTVRVPAFLLAKTECTQAAWDRIGGEDKRKRSHEKLPIDGVSWDDAKAWCGKAGLRLPSEAEWEYACRAGSDDPWSFGADENALAGFATFVGNSGGQSTGAGARKPNAFGFHDMHGNLWEWCEDVWHETYEGAPTDGSAWTEGDPAMRAKRGGALNSTPTQCRSAIRLRLKPDFRFFIIGFRPAKSLP